MARQLDGDDGLIWLDGDGSDLGRWVTWPASPGVIHCRGLPGDPEPTTPLLHSRLVWPLEQLAELRSGRLD